MRPTKARAKVAALACALGLVVSTNQAFALEPPLEPGRSKIHAGIALMVGGALVTGLGAGLYVANENAQRTSCAPCAETSWVFPTVIMAVGGAMFLGGVPVFVIGQVERQRAMISLAPTGASLKVDF